MKQNTSSYNSLWLKYVLGTFGEGSYEEYLTGTTSWGKLKKIISLTL